MPAVTAPLFGFLLGIAFAWVSSSELERTGIFGRPLLVSALFSLLVFAPICAFFLSFAPDWAYAYVVDPQRLPGAVDLTAVLVDAASVPTGFAAAARFARSRRPAPIVRLAALPAVAAAGLTLLFSPRLGIQATHAQFHGDFGTRSVSGTPLGYALLWMALVLVCAITWTLAWLRRSSRITSHA